MYLSAMLAAALVDVWVWRESVRGRAQTVFV